MALKIVHRNSAGVVARQRQSNGSTGSATRASYERNAATEIERVIANHLPPPTVFQAGMIAPSQGDAANYS
jgi:hypothetical protein